MFERLQSSYNTETHTFFHVTIQFNFLTKAQVNYSTACSELQSNYTALLCTKKSLNDPNNHDGVVTHLKSDILECEVKWALRSITTNKASGGDGIPAKLFHIQKGDAVEVLHSICQQIWKTQQWPQDWKRLVYISILQKGNTKEC